MPNVRAILCAVLVSGCASSLLIDARDPTFGRALERFGRTRSLVAAEEAPVEETSMFLLGEALDQYRFAGRPRSASSYGAQVAAAALDFPAFQSLAGSFDLFDLRLRARDGAVQIWETLLQRYPRTTLKPLVLYRLGWAYRSVVAPGFPRSSAEVFDELLTEFPDSPLAPLVQAAKAVPWKSQSTATAWSVVPGLGQIYAGEYLNGSVRVTVSLAGAAMVLVPVVIAYNRRNELTWSDDWPLLATGLAGLVVLSIDYSDSYDDAHRAVMEFNERHEATFEAAHPEAP